MLTFAHITPPRSIYIQLWKKHYKVDGQITQHLSPFEQKIVAPLFKDAHVKILKNFLEKAIEAGPGLGLGVAVFFWGNSYFDQCAYDHRP